MAHSSLSEMLVALDFRHDTPKEIVIVTPTAQHEAEPFLGQLRKTYVPNRALSVVTVGSTEGADAELVPALRGKIAQGGKATACVCERQTCELPTKDPDLFGRQLRKMRSLR